MLRASMAMMMQPSAARVRLRQATHAAPSTGRFCPFTDQHVRERQGRLQKTRAPLLGEHSRAGTGASASFTNCTGSLGPARSLLLLRAASTAAEEGGAEVYEPATMRRPQLPPNSGAFTVISWNVAGLRALVRKVHLPPSSVNAPRLLEQWHPVRMTRDDLY